MARAIPRPLIRSPAIGSVSAELGEKRRRRQLAVVDGFHKGGRTL
jgi:hypothetical protein